MVGWLILGSNDGWCERVGREGVGCEGVGRKDYERGRIVFGWLEGINVGCLERVGRRGDRVVLSSR